MSKEIKRYNPSVSEGLTTEQVEQRKRDNLVNFDTEVPTKSIKQILAGNFFTLFNLINLLLGIAVFSVHSYKNLLFLGVVVCNTLISTYQEVHSKRVIDQLSIISSTKLHAIRNGKKEELAISEIVLDDMLEFETGNQVVTDCIIQEGEVEVDESFITGESEAVLKKKGDMLLSGSFIISGKASARVEHIGSQNYTSKISSGAKYIKKVNSEIMNSLNQIIRVISVVIIPLGLLLFYHQMQLVDNSFQAAVVNTVAAIIGMIPEGLVLLTSTVLAVSVIRLSKYKVLVQELYCIETLARVDTLCLDKTGTITEGKMEVHSIVPSNVEEKEMKEILENIASASEDNNVTIQAIRDFSEKQGEWKVNKRIAFSSKKKWSGVNFEGKGSYILGAPEFILGEELKKQEKFLKEYSKENRVLLLAYSKSDFEGKELPKQIEIIGFVLIRDKIRKEAKSTLQYFKEQGVNIRIISGDNPITVANIAKRAGVEGYENYIDMSTIGEKSIEEVAKKYTIFGRVSPEQKKELVVALKKQGHTVAMTGDGVNDVLALKEADCSIAIASGSDAARNVSQLVLLDSNFSSMPKVVAEGRRTINNIGRSATLFLVKTIYASLLAIIFLFLSDPYPFMPIQMSLINMVTIGIPSFILALEPNKERVKGNFLVNVIKKAIPPGITVVVNIMVVTILSHFLNLSTEVTSTLCVLLTAVTGFVLLYKISKPFNIVRTVLFITVILIYIAGITIFKSWFFITHLTNEMTMLGIGLILFAILNFYFLNFIISRIKPKKIERVEVA